MSADSAKATVSSMDIVRALMQHVQTLTTLMNASVFIAFQAEDDTKFVYSSGHLKEVYEAGALKPSTSDIDMAEKEPTPNKLNKNDSENKHSRISEISPDIKFSYSTDATATTTSAYYFPVEGQTLFLKNINKGNKHKQYKLSKEDLRDAFMRVYGPFGLLKMAVDVIADPNGDEEHTIAFLEFPDKKKCIEAHRVTPTNLLLCQYGRTRYSQVASHILTKYDPRASRLVDIRTDGKFDFAKLSTQLSKFGKLMGSIRDVTHKEEFSEGYQIAQVEFANISNAHYMMRNFEKVYPYLPFQVRWAKPHFTNVVWLGGFPPYVINKNIEEFCSKFGKVTDVFVNKPAHAAASALIFYETTTEAILAIAGLKKTTVLGGTFLQVDVASMDFRKRFLDPRGMDHWEEAKGVNLENMKQNVNDADLEDIESLEDMDEAETSGGWRGDAAMAQVEQMRVVKTEIISQEDTDTVGVKTEILGQEDTDTVWGDKSSCQEATGRQDKDGKNRVQDGRRSNGDSSSRIFEDKSMRSQDIKRGRDESNRKRRHQNIGQEEDPCRNHEKHYNRSQEKDYISRRSLDRAARDKDDLDRSTGSSEGRGRVYYEEDNPSPDRRIKIQEKRRQDEMRQSEHSSSSHHNDNNKGTVHRTALLPTPQELPTINSFEIFVTNLDTDVKLDTIRWKFHDFKPGKVQLRQSGGRYSGIRVATISFATRKKADEALEQMQGEMLGTRRMAISRDLKGFVAI